MAKKKEETVQVTEQAPENLDPLVATQSEVDDLKKQVSTLTRANTELSSTVDALKLSLEEAKKASGVDDNDHVYFRGQRYDIVHKNRVWELLEDFKKRFVDENMTAIVIDHPF